MSASSTYHANETHPLNIGDRYIHSLLNFETKSIPVHTYKYEKLHTSLYYPDLLG